MGMLNFLKKPIAKLEIDFVIKQNSDFYTLYADFNSLIEYIVKNTSEERRPLFKEYFSKDKIFYLWIKLQKIKFLKKTYYK